MTTPTPRRLTWGLEPPDAATSAWGARAIYTTDPMVIDLLVDRQSAFGPRMRTLIDWMNEDGLPALKREILAHDVLPADQQRIEILDGAFKLAASPRGSHGYLYIVAWAE